MRVVLDTNIIVSAAMSNLGFPAQILHAWDEERFELLVSPDLLAEYRAVLGYDRIRRRHRLNDDQLNQMVNEYRHGGIMIVPEEPLVIVAADPDDNRVIECAVAGAATHIVSGDPHLLELGRYRDIRILTPRAFINVLTTDRDR